LKSGQQFVVDYFFKLDKADNDDGMIDVFDMIDAGNDDVNDAENSDGPPAINYLRLNEYFGVFIMNHEVVNNPVLAGYFCAIMDSLIQRQGRLLVDYLFEKDRSSAILDLLGLPSITKLASTMLTFNDTDEDEYEDEAFGDGYVKPETIAQKHKDCKLIEGIRKMAIGDNIDELVAVDSILSAIDDDGVSCSMANELVYRLLSDTEALNMLLVKLTAVSGNEEIRDANKFRLSILNRLLTIGNVDRRLEKCTSQSPLAMANNTSYKRQAIASSLLDRLIEDGTKHEQLNSFFENSIEKICDYLEQV
jgi:hypothetical protein